MNPTPHPAIPDSTIRAQARAIVPPPAFHGLRAFIPRAAMRRAPMLARPETPSYETRTFPIELTYMS